MCGASSLSGSFDSSQPGGGTVFELSGSSRRPSTPFCSEATCLDGEYPSAGVIMDSGGNLLGATGQGGKDSIGENEGDGTISELIPQ